MREVGPNELELRRVLSDKVENDGLINMHITWGPEGDDMSPEEKARYIIDHVINRDTSNDVRITASELDRQTLAPHVSKEDWELLTPEGRRREIDRGTAERMQQHIWSG